MDYKKIYNQIIERAKNRNISGYYEKHHIIPRCMGGNDLENNLVNLTPKEHFLCHMLLCEIYPDNNKLKHALFLMATGKQKPKEQHYHIGGRVYERLKTEFSQMLTGQKHSQETKNKKSKTMKQVWASKSDEEIKSIAKKRIQSRKNNGTEWHSEEWKKKQSKVLKGRKITWDRGIHRSIIQYDLDGNFIREWESAKIAAQVIKNKTNGSDIIACLKGRQKTAYGYKWTTNKV